MSDAAIEAPDAKFFQFLRPVQDLTEKEALTELTNRLQFNREFVDAAQGLAPADLFVALCAAREFDASENEKSLERHRQGFDSVPGWPTPTREERCAESRAEAEEASRKANNPAGRPSRGPLGLVRTSG